METYLMNRLKETSKKQVVLKKSTVREFNPRKKNKELRYQPNLYSSKKAKKRKNKLRKDQMQQSAFIVLLAPLKTPDR